ncbi:MAG: response regulator transcription factor [Planctomycetes bacterium]|nr:response regulator transcription factor [Planctomycetota bacterium]
MRVLVIEDEIDLARAIKEALQLGGFAVDLARDGIDGRHMALGIDYDLVVLDLMLPGLDGFSLLDDLRCAKKTPVLILSARDALEERVRGLDAGADDYLTKPFEIDELLARARALVRRSVGQAKTTMVVGTLVVDLNARTVTKDGLVLGLTPKEFAILELLAMKRGSVVTRTMIHEHVYDAQDSTTSNVVDVLISTLRGKIGRGLIHTRRGQGFMIDAED